MADFKHPVASSEGELHPSNPMKLMDLEGDNSVYNNTRLVLTVFNTKLYVVQKASCYLPVGACSYFDAIN